LYITTRKIQVLLFKFVPSSKHTNAKNKEQIQMTDKSSAHQLMAWVQKPGGVSDTEPPADAHGI
jgi:hypothetical protein